MSTGAAWTARHCAGLHHCQPWRGVTQVVRQGGGATVRNLLSGRMSSAGKDQFYRPLISGSVACTHPHRLLHVLPPQRVAVGSPPTGGRRQAPERRQRPRRINCRP